MNLKMFRDLSHAKKYPEGTLLINEGFCEELYIVLTGKAGVYLNYNEALRQLIEVVGPGDLIGEKQFFQGKNTFATVAVIEDIIAVPINKDTCFDFISKEPEISLELMKIIYKKYDDLKSKYEKAVPELTEQKAPKVKKADIAQVKKTPDTPAVIVEKEEKKSEPSGPSSLFPEGHGTYALPLNNNDKEHLIEKSVECPICKRSFKTLAVKHSKLVLEKTGEDMRNYYIGVEPLYYDVITCPNCLYSALSDMFGSPDKRNDMQQELKAIKAETNINSGTSRDTFSVFAGYYLALECTPRCFVNNEMAMARLFLKLSWLYRDCGDAGMEEKILSNALEAYMHVYEKVNLSAAQEQQLCIIIGGIYLKLGETDNAKNFLLKAKTNREGAPAYKDQADNILFEIREAEKKKA